MALILWAILPTFKAAGANIGRLGSFWRMPIRVTGLLACFGKGPDKRGESPGVILEKMMSPGPVGSEVHLKEHFR